MANPLPAWWQDRARVLFEELSGLLELEPVDDDQQDKLAEFITDMHEWIVRTRHVGDRHAAYLVVLKHTMREQRAEDLTRLFCLIDGVISVVPVESDYQQVVGAERVRGELAKKLYDLSREVLHSDG